MLNEERIILMTHLASYEAKEGKKSVSTGNYFRSDYIKMQTVQSIFAGAIAFVILCGIAAMYDFEAFMGDIYQQDMFVYGRRFLYLFLLFVGVYAVVSYVVYSIRYRKARRSLKNYYNYLMKLSAMYENNSKTPKGNEND